MKLKSLKAQPLLEPPQQESLWAEVKPEHVKGMVEFLEFNAGQRRWEIFLTHAGELKKLGVRVEDKVRAHKKEIDEAVAEKARFNYTEFTQLALLAREFGLDYKPVVESNMTHIWNYMGHHGEAHPDDGLTSGLIVNLCRLGVDNWAHLIGEAVASAPKPYEPLFAYASAYSDYLRKLGRARLANVDVSEYIQAQKPRAEDILRRLAAEGTWDRYAWVASAAVEAGMDVKGEAAAHGPALRLQMEKLAKESQWGSYARHASALMDLGLLTPLRQDTQRHIPPLKRFGGAV
jgi:hypothetical protein